MLRIFALSYANHIILCFTENCQVGNCRRQVKKKMASVKIIHKKIAEIRIVKGLFA